MSLVHIMTGLPASGKTTHARTLDAMRFSLDDYRAMMWNTEWSKKREHVAVQALLGGAKAAVALGHDICLDNTHLTPSLPKTYRKEFARLGVTFQVHSFLDVPIEECIRRDASRDKPVGEEVIRRLEANFQKAKKNGWRLTDEWMNGDSYVAPELYVGDENLPSIVIVDLDGTVALNDGHRGHYEYEKVGDDQPNPNVINIVRAIHSNYQVVFMSGREDRCRDDTTKWLWKHLWPVSQSLELHMRTTGDHRPDYIIKGELFDKHIRGRYNVVSVLDDRNQCIDLWRNMGLTALQVAPGDF